MGRPPKDPVLMRLQTSGKYEQYLKKFGMPPELPPEGDLSEADLPIDPKTGRQIDLGAFAGGLLFGALKVRGVRRHRAGGAIAGFSYFEPEPSLEWKRSAAFMQVIARILLAGRTISRHQRRNLVELRKELPDFPPNSALPRFPDELGTPEEFFELWKDGYLDVTIRFRDRSNREILLYSTGLREFEESVTDEPEDLEEATEPSGHWEGLTFIPDPKKSD